MPLYFMPMYFTSSYAYTFFGCTMLFFGFCRSFKNRYSAAGLSIHNAFGYWSQQFGYFKVCKRTRFQFTAAFYYNSFILVCSGVNCLDISKKKGPV